MKRIIAGLLLGRGLTVGKREEIKEGPGSKSKKKKRRKEKKDERESENSRSIIKEQRNPKTSSKLQYRYQRRGH